MQVRFAIQKSAVLHFLGSNDWPENDISYEFTSYCFNRGKDSQGEEVIKPYTPTTLDSDLGHFDLVIKVSLEITFLTNLLDLMAVLFTCILGLIPICIV